MSRIHFIARPILLIALFISVITVIVPSHAFALIWSNWLDPVEAGVGARPLGMGNAFVAAADDANSIFLNPAGLSFTKSWGMTCGISSVRQDTTNTNFGIYFPSSDEAWGIGIISQSNPNPLTYLPTREPITARIITVEASPATSQYSSSVAMLSYGVKLGKYINLPIINNTSFGISFKGFSQVVESSDETYSANGFDVDVGLIYPISSWFKFGLYGQDMLPEASGGKLSWITGYEEPLPYIYKTGISTKLLGKDGLLNTDQTLYFNFDTEKSQYYDDLPTIYHGGIEWWPLDNTAVRLGNDQALVFSTSPQQKYVVEDNYTGGIGMRFGDFSFDYAYHRYGKILDDYKHYISISYSFPVIKEKPVVAVVTKEVVQAPVTEEYLAIKSPEDKLTILDDSVLVSCEVLSSKVAKVDINGNVMEISWEAGLATGEARKSIYANVSVPSIGKFSIKIKCLDSAGTLLKEYKTRLVRLPYFSDVPKDYWARDKIIVLSALNLFGGYPDGTFKPGKPINRAELTSILVKASGYVTPEEVDSGFKDVKKGNWAAYYIKNGVDLGFVSGYSDNTFKPLKNVTRAEGVTLVAGFAGFKNPEVAQKSPYNDVPIHHWAANTISAAKEAGILEYVTGKFFYPKKEMTRAEAVEIMSQTKLVRDRALELYNWESGF